MTAWRFIAQRALTGELLDLELPLALSALRWDLSGPGSLTGTVAPDTGTLRAADGRLLLEEWGTFLYAEADGEIRWGGIVVSSGFEGSSWKVEAAGFTTYPNGLPYTANYSKVQADPADVVRDLWKHIQSHADGNLGVVVTGTTTARIGSDSTAALATATEDATAAKADYDAANAKLKDVQAAETAARRVYTTRTATRTARSKDVTAANSALSAAKRGVTAAKRAVTAAEKTKDPAKIAAARQQLASAQSKVTSAQSDVDAANRVLNEAKAAQDAQKRAVDAAAAKTDAQAAVVKRAKTVSDKAKATQAEAKKTEKADGGAYRLDWWDSPDVGEEIDSLAKETPFDYVEEHAWSGDTITHTVRIGYPRIGRHRADLSFVQGENVTSVVTPTIDGDDFANEVVGIGAGEGRAALRRTTAVRDGRLRRAAVFSGKDVTSAGRMDALIRDELQRRGLTLSIDSVEVVDHPNARIGSWSVGDDVDIFAELPWLGDVELRCRITAWELLSDTRARLSLAPSDSFTYGG